MDERDGIMDGPSATAAGVCKDFDVDNVPPPARGHTVVPGDSHCGRGGAGGEWAPGFEREGLSGDEGCGEKAGQEMTLFCEKGVTVVNIHGEASFQPLDEWRREKERFDALSRMDLCRR